MAPLRTPTPQSSSSSSVPLHRAWQGLGARGPVSKGRPKARSLLFPLPWSFLRSRRVSGLPSPTLLFQEYCSGTGSLRTNCATPASHHYWTHSPSPGPPRHVYHLLTHWLVFPGNGSESSSVSSVPCISALVHGLPSLSFQGKWHLPILEATQAIQQPAIPQRLRWARHSLPRAPLVSGQSQCHQDWQTSFSAACTENKESAQ